MINHVNGNLLNVTEGIICHQVNCQGVMGSGVAKQIRDRWPEVYSVFKTHSNAYLHRPEHLLGGVDLVRVEENLSVANFYAQFNYGYDGQLYTMYDKVELCVLSLAARTTQETWHVPYRMGCDRGGGDWGVYLGILEEYSPKHVTIVVHHFKGD